MTRKEAVLKLLEESDTYLYTTAIHKRLPPPHCEGSESRTYGAVKELWRERKIVRAYGPKEGVAWVYGVKGKELPDKDLLPLSAGARNRKFLDQTWRNRKKREKFRKAYEKRQ